MFDKPAGWAAGAAVSKRKLPDSSRGRGRPRHSVAGGLIRIAHILVQKIPQKKLSFSRKIQKTKDRRFFLPLDLWF
jgi:hypothetical protein